MTDRNFKKELSHDYYYDMENGHNNETIDYDCLVDILTELCDRIEQLENKVDELKPNPRWSLD